MLYAIISDIHANYDALQAVLKEVDDLSPDQIICLGDIVGYGAQPAECVQEIRSRRIPTVAGNHDFAAAEQTAIDYFNPEARRSVHWTRSMLGKDDIEFLQSLPLVLHYDQVTAFHGTLTDPKAFDYIVSPYDAASSLSILTTGAGLCGHSHLPGIFLQYDRTISYHTGGEVTIPPAATALINAGSVGQPRDSTPFAAFATYDTDARLARIIRTEYDTDAAVQKIIAAGLPEMNAYRLIIGR